LDRAAKCSINQATESMDRMNACSQSRSRSSSADVPKLASRGRGHTVRVGWLAFGGQFNGYMVIANIILRHLVTAEVWLYVAQVRIERRSTNLTRRG
jgi:hypothetical protein